ncbi:MAG: extracellular solute-binding protein [Patescibacteria group bacterium]|jgi:multiple sugar transport system substrate-binding protein
MKKSLRLLALIVVSSLFLSAARCGSSSSSSIDNPSAPTLTKEPITLEYWRLWDESSLFDSYIKAYQSEHPNITIEVKKIEIKPGYDVYAYQRDIIKAIADGAGPDMFMIHNTWLPYQINQISSLPEGLMTTKEYKEIFPTVVQEDFIDNDKVYAIPYSTDNLMLFYNTDIFTEKKIKQPPKTLQELVDIVPKLTERNSQGKIIRSAIPLGGSEGIPRASDILAALMMQYGAEMTSADRKTTTFNLPASGSNPAFFSGQEALAYYTQFTNPASSVYTFTDDKDASGNRLFPSDVQSFMEGKSAMFLGYAYQVANIRKFAPKLHFETAPLPQRQIQDPVTIANYWGETVSKTSQYPNEAWDFIKFMISKTNQSQLRRDAGYVSARKDNVEKISGRRYYGTVADQIGYSRSWYRKNTADVEAIFTAMITSVVRDKVSPSIAIDAAVRDINAL